MLTLMAEQPECLWDEALPIEVKELPEDLAALDVLLADPELLWPIVERFRREVVEERRAVLTDGRPTIAMETYIRMMVLKQRYRWGYRTLVAEVSDSIHLRRFCRIITVGAGAGRVDGPQAHAADRSETVSELTRAMIVKACREKRFRPRAVRVDSTVVDADVKYPTDSGLASSGVTVLARAGRKLAKLIGEKKARVRDRSRSMGRKLRAITRTVRRRSGEAKQEVLKLTEQTGELLERSVKEARRLAKIARGTARGRGAKAKLRAAGEVGGDGRQLREGRRPDPQAGRRASRSRTGSCRLFDPDARPIRKGKLGKPNEFGFVSQLAEVTEHTQSGARGLILPAAATEIGNPGEDTLLPDDDRGDETARDPVQEVALDGGFNVGPTSSALADLQPKNVFIAGRQEPGSKRTARRMRRYRTGAEGRISHLKRRYGLDRSRLKGNEGRQIWTEWSILAYNLDTLTVRER